MVALPNWAFNLYTGLFSTGGELSSLPQDPLVFFYGGELPAMALRPHVVSSGGAGFTKEQALAACIGEGVERSQSFLFPQDQLTIASFAKWPLDEFAIAPSSWVLFHPEQYQIPHFPFKPLTADTECEWLCFRQVITGQAYWVPSEFAFLHPSPRKPHRWGPTISTGLSCHSQVSQAVLRGTQEVIERDAIMRAWWKHEAVEEWPEDFFWDHTSYAQRLKRPNLTYRFFRLVSPYSSYVTLVTVYGETQGGFLFAVGTACRETLIESFCKSILESIQGLQYVRHLKEEYAKERLTWKGACLDFPEHAVYYSLFPDQLTHTGFGNTGLFLRQSPSFGVMQEPKENVQVLAEKLGKEKPILFRNLTSPHLPLTQIQLAVVRVVIPGLQPLHGSDEFPFLGGPLWYNRTVKDFAAFPPHPFP